MRLKLIGLAVLSLVIFVSFLVFSFSHEGEKQIEASVSSEEAIDEVQKEIESVRDIQSKATSWIYGLDKDDEVALNVEENKEVSDSNENPVGAVKYLLAGLQLNDPDIFFQAFSPDVFATSIHEHPNEDKYEALLEFMDEISRNNRLVEAELLVSVGAFGIKNLDDSVLRLYYTDDVQVDINVTFISEGHHHGSASGSISHEMAYINTPLQEIVDQIKRNIISLG